MQGAMLLAQASSRLATEKQQQAGVASGVSSRRLSSDGGSDPESSSPPSAQPRHRPGGVVEGMDDDDSSDEDTDDDEEEEGRGVVSKPRAPPVATNQFGILPANNLADLPGQVRFWGRGGAADAGGPHKHMGCLQAEPGSARRRMWGMYGIMQGTGEGGGCYHNDRHHATITGSPAGPVGRHHAAITGWRVDPVGRHHAAITS